MLRRSDDQKFAISYEKIVILPILLYLLSFLPMYLNSPYCSCRCYIYPLLFILIAIQTYRRFLVGGMQRKSFLLVLKAQLPHKADGDILNFEDR